MIFKHVSPVITTTKLKETLEFYKSIFDFQIVFEADWYVHLTSKDQSIELGFMLPGLKDQKEEYRPEFSGKGLIYNFEVDNPDDWFQKLNSKNITFIESLKNEPWGERHFTLMDPNGIVVNVTKQIEPDESFKESYV